MLRWERYLERNGVMRDAELLHSFDRITQKKKLLGRCARMLDRSECILKQQNMVVWNGFIRLSMGTSGELANIAINPQFSKNTGKLLTKIQLFCGTDHIIEMRR
jgi:hypothetical protein